MKTVIKEAMLILFFSCVALRSGAQGVETAAQEAAKTVQTAIEKPAADLDQLSIQADTVEMDFAKHSAVFTGNVHVEDSAMMLDADKMTVFLQDGNELQRIEAEGNVVIRETGSDRTAKAGKAIYDVSADTVTLTESPSLIESGRGMMTEAESFIYNRAAQTFVATGRPRFQVLVKKSSGGAAGGLLGLDGKSEGGEGK